MFNYLFNWFFSMICFALGQHRAHRAHAGTSMCVCVCVCVDEHVCVCVCVCVHVCMYVCVYARARFLFCMCAHVYVHVCVCRASDGFMGLRRAREVGCIGLVWGHRALPKTFRRRGGAPAKRPPWSSNGLLLLRKVLRRCYADMYWRDPFKNHFIELENCYAGVTQACMCMCMLMCIRACMCVWSCECECACGCACARACDAHVGVNVDVHVAC
jgi:hypothetical protein